MTENGPEFRPSERSDEENRRLREENVRLRQILSSHGIPVPLSSAVDFTLTQAIGTALLESKEERSRKRLALFRGLFRGREDVYARRWENVRGQSGYSPAMLRDWKAINESRPEDRKKVDLKTRKFLPLTDTVIEGHLLGNGTIGVYPLFSDETCWFLAVDFDKKTWERDSSAFLETCFNSSASACAGSVRPTPITLPGVCLEASVRSGVEVLGRI